MNKHGVPDRRPSSRATFTDTRRDPESRCSYDTESKGILLYSEADREREWRRIAEMAVRDSTPESSIHTEGYGGIGVGRREIPSRSDDSICSDYRSLPSFHSEEFKTKKSPQYNVSDERRQKSDPRARKECEAKRDAEIQREIEYLERKEREDKLRHMEDEEQAAQKREFSDQLQRESEEQERLTRSLLREEERIRILKEKFENESKLSSKPIEHSRKSIDDILDSPTPSKEISSPVHQAFGSPSSPSSTVTSPRDIPVLRLKKKLDGEVSGRKNSARGVTFSTMNAQPNRDVTKAEGTNAVRHPHSKTPAKNLHVFTYDTSTEEVPTSSRVRVDVVGSPRAVTIASNPSDHSKVGANAIRVERSNSPQIRAQPGAFRRVQKVASPVPRIEKKGLSTCGTNADAVRSLSQVDAQIFTGVNGHPGLLSQSMAIKMLRTVNLVRRIVWRHVVQYKRHEKEKGKAWVAQHKVVIGGAETSGRIAYQICQLANSRLEAAGIFSPCFFYSHSGGDGALFTANQTPDDDPFAGGKDLRRHLCGVLSSVYIGLTPDFSSPYVAGQAAECFDLLDSTPRLSCAISVCVIGFANQKEASHLNDEWSKSCNDIFSLIEEKEGVCIGDEGLIDITEDSDSEAIQCSFVNPTIGEDSLLGTHRGKHGTALKVILEVISTVAIDSALRCCLNSDATSESRMKVTIQEDMLSIYECLMDCERVLRLTSLADASISNIGETVGNAILNGGSVYYLGGEALGRCGLVEVSDYPDTFSSSYNDSRAFIHNGWDSIKNNSKGKPLEGDLYKISLNDFGSDFVPNLKSNDVVVFMVAKKVGEGSWCEGRIERHTLHEFDEVQSLSNLKAQCTSKGVKICALSISTGSADSVALTLLQGGDTSSSVPVAHLWLGHSSTRLHLEGAAELACRVALTYITIISQRVKGTILGGRLVRSLVTSSRVFKEAISTVADVAQCEMEVAFRSLVRAIHDLDDPKEDILSKPIAFHVERASFHTHDLPLAISLASSPWFTLQDAKRALSIC